MGLIKAALGAANSVLADQWKEFFYCDALGNDVLMKKGQKRITSRSSNTKGSDNIISNGSGIVVNDGQCMIIVDQGEIVEVCAEPGEFTYDTSSEPSIFSGKFGDSLKESFKLFGRRFAYGGDTGKDQRVYYFNTKEILDNKFGTPSPIAFRVVDAVAGVDIDMNLRCSGIYTYLISDPIRFYKKLAANVSEEYNKTEIDSTLKNEFISHLQPAFAKISDLGIRPNQIVAHNSEICAAMKEELSAEWGERGLSVEKVSIGTATLSEEDMVTLQQLQKAKVNMDANRAFANQMTANQDAMRTAAGNTSGAMAGFMGMGMANSFGGGNAVVGDIFQAAQASKANAAPAAGGWKCSCGNIATGNFCTECGARKPAADGWKCSCGAVNKGKFCSECGSAKPAGAPLYKCDKCGWEPEDPHNPPKFCPECGDIFDDRDKQ